MTEQWKPVPGWPEYEISDYGNCRSTERVVDGKLNSDGIPSRRRLAGKLLTPVIHDSGLVCFNLWCENDYTQFHARRLVLMAFDRPRPRGMDAVNVDGDLSNNRLDNLRWAHSASAAEIRRAMAIQ